jgi:hypothetical protein
MRLRSRVLPVILAFGGVILSLPEDHWQSAEAQPFTFAGNAQHTGLYNQPAQHLNAIRWSTVIDLSSSGTSAHYGAPIITSGNTVIIGVGPGTVSQVSAFDGSNGRFKYTLPTDYKFPTANWRPVYQPVIAPGPAGPWLYFPGAGGCVFRIGTYNSNSTNYNRAIFINTPITSDTT